MRDFYLCRECALAKHCTWPEGHVASSHVSKCYLCQENKSICAASDWNWPREDEESTLDREI